MSPGRVRNGQTPPVLFDGQYCWYPQWYDPTDDRCCRCRRLITGVALELFRDVGRETWQARFCESCTSAVVALLLPLDRVIKT